MSLAAAEEQLRPDRGRRILQCGGPREGSPEGLWGLIRSLEIFVSTPRRPAGLTLTKPREARYISLWDLKHRLSYEFANNLVGSLSREYKKYTFLYAENTNIEERGCYLEIFLSLREVINSSARAS